MRVVSLCLALLLAAAVSVHAGHYKKILNTDVETHAQIDKLYTRCERELRLACDARPECHGFTTDGVLVSNAKSGVQRASVDGSTHLFAKESASKGPSNVWPAPQSWSAGAATVAVAYPFKFTTTTPSPDLTVAFTRFTAQTFPQRPINPAKPPAALLSELKVVVANVDVPLQLGVDESYELTIPADGSAATLTANTYYGALHGMETFSQLVNFDYNAHGYVVGNAPWSITDAPRFPHRGLMIDTARHFEPVHMIKRVIDSITYAKFNTLHWHVVDSQAFPFESRTYPLLWTGAYSPQERYTQEDMADVVEYARQRGVRVVIEFDVPGHAESWCTGYPDVCPAPSCPVPLDPSNENIFNLLTGVFGEVTGNKTGLGIFPENMIHLGGDEVDTTCWTTTPRIADWMAAQKWDVNDAYKYIVDRAHKLVQSMGRTPVNWEEVFLHFGSKLDKNTIIHVWLDHETLHKVVEAGYRGILSNEDVWYLDHLAVPWTAVYLNEPYQGITDPKQQQLVLGGEITMWGETVDPSNIMNTIWPRAAAGAERLWSPADLIDTDAALPRLQRFRCLLNSRGIGAAPVLVPNGRDAPPTPGGCYVQ